MFASYPLRTPRRKSAFRLSRSGEQLYETQTRTAHSDQELQGEWAVGKTGGSCGPGLAGARARALPSVRCVAVCRLSSECGPLPICCCLNCAFPRLGLPKLSPAVTSCQPVVSPRRLSLPRDHPALSAGAQKSFLTGGLGDRRRSRPEHPTVRARPR